jgi:hypothetical protein
MRGITYGENIDQGSTGDQMLPVRKPLTCIIAELNYLRSHVGERVSRTLPYFFHTGIYQPLRGTGDGAVRVPSYRRPLLGPCCPRAPVQSA